MVVLGVECRCVAMAGLENSLVRLVRNTRRRLAKRLGMISLNIRLMCRWLRSLNLSGLVRWTKVLMVWLILVSWLRGTVTLRVSLAEFRCL